MQIPVRDSRPGSLKKILEVPLQVMRTSVTFKFDCGKSFSVVEERNLLSSHDTSLLGTFPEFLIVSFGFKNGNCQ